MAGIRGSYIPNWRRTNHNFAVRKALSAAQLQDDQAPMLFPTQSPTREAIMWENFSDNRRK
ncbi:hypothetical protein MMC11_005796, partial [Xylographa trunciseda]|nr:hypothetical protein [Xylographa trunciseda]